MISQGVTAFWMHLIYSLLQHNSKGALWPLVTGSWPLTGVRRAWETSWPLQGCLSKTAPCPPSNCHRKLSDPLWILHAVTVRGFIWFKGQVPSHIQAEPFTELGNQQSCEAGAKTQCLQRRDMPDHESCRFCFSALQFNIGKDRGTQTS